MITPELTMMEEFYAVGYAVPGPVGQFDAMEYGAFWQGQDFSSVSKEDYAKLAGANCGEVGTWVRFSNKGEQNFYFFGPMVADKSFVPEGMVAVKFPGCVYAAFELSVNEDHEQFRQEIKDCWKNSILPWLATSVCRPDKKGRCFEYYYGDKCYIYLPIESRVSK